MIKMCNTWDGAIVDDSWTNPREVFKIDYSHYMSNCHLKPKYAFARGANRKHPLDVDNLQTIDIEELYGENDERNEDEER